MTIETFEDAPMVAKAAARRIADEAAAAIAARGRFTLALSGGATPWMMLRELADEAVAWEAVHIFQVDERIVPKDYPDRNLLHMRENFLDRVPLGEGKIHAMPVEAPDLQRAAEDYAREFRSFAGAPVIDLVHLGLGTDGHTAALVPGDPVLDVGDLDVALTGVYRGLCRMTLTYPMINRARRILWVITGGDKAQMLDGLQRGDWTIPAGRVRRDAALIIADRAAVNGAAEGPAGSVACV